MFDANIAIAVILGLLLVVFVRIALTLRDISDSLAAMAGGERAAVPAPAVKGQAVPAPANNDAEIAAVIAVAKAAMQGSLK